MNLTEFLTEAITDTMTEAINDAIGEEMRKIIATEVAAALGEDGVKFSSSVRAAIMQAIDSFSADEVLQ